MLGPNMAERLIKCLYKYNALILKEPITTGAAILNIYSLFFFSENIRLKFHVNPLLARQRIYMEHRKIDVTKRKASSAAI